MSSKDASEWIYQHLKRDLMLGNLHSSEMINEQALAEQYACSRTPIREAAGRLAVEGYLVKYAGKGYFIRVLSEVEVRQLRECRYILECGVIDILIAHASDSQLRGLEQAAAQCQDEILYANTLAFHIEMAKLAGNSKLEKMVEKLLYLLVRPLVNMRYPVNTHLDPELQRSDGVLSAEHRAILDALLERDAEKAKALLREDMYPVRF